MTCEAVVLRKHASAPSGELTALQAQVLRFINGHRHLYQCNPTRMEIARHFGWRSNNAADTHVVALVQKGVLKLRSGQSRGFIVQPDWVNK
jgi:repressor LexA